MRAREFLFEDSRSKIEKLQELIDHPSTEENVRDVARGRLELLMASECPVDVQERMPITTNVHEEDLDRPFLTGVSLGDLYDGLGGLQPGPSEIKFGRQGIIHMVVPPPFMGKTKQQYMNEIYQACPGARNISGNMLGEGLGYLFIISYL